ncbi:hypothetical protein ABW19_dt0203059 [Dactylella cylindrospora]|nr:hypothetical protein ABW19_dt0203059 [Dactylella cylindrospora]
MRESDPEPKSKSNGTSHRLRRLPHLPCCLHPRDGSTDTFDTSTLTKNQREQIVDKILRLVPMLTSPERTSPRPLVFLISISRTGIIYITLQSKKAFGDTTNREYNPFFLLPSECLEGLDDADRAGRRELFAVGCLIFHILEGKMPHEIFGEGGAATAYRCGVYPREVLDLYKWFSIMMLWSPEFADELNRRTTDPKRTTANVLKKVAAGVGVAGAAVVTTAILSPIILPAIGFGSAGIVGGSLAAGVQSGIGLVEAGSVFALLQSAGMGGAAGAAAIATAGVTAAAATTAATVASLVAKNIEESGLDKKELFQLFSELVRKENETEETGQEEESSSESDEEPEEKNAMAKVMWAVWPREAKVKGRAREIIAAEEDAEGELTFFEKK